MLKIKSLKVMEKMLADLWLPLINEQELQTLIELETEILLAPGSTTVVVLNTPEGPATLNVTVSEGDSDTIQMKYNTDAEVPIGTLILMVEGLEWQE